MPTGGRFPGLDRIEHPRKGVLLMSCLIVKVQDLCLRKTPSR